MSAPLPRRGWPTAVDRDSIAAALSTVPGIQGVPYRPSTISARIGWPGQAQRRRINDHAAEITWYGWVALGGSEVTASELADQIEWDVEDALARLGRIVATDRVQLPADKGGFYALRVTFEATSERPSR